MQPSGQPVALQHPHSDMLEGIHRWEEKRPSFYLTSERSPCEPTESFQMVQESGTRDQKPKGLCRGGAAAAPGLQTQDENSSPHYQIN